MKLVADNSTLSPKNVSKPKPLEYHEHANDSGVLKKQKWMMEEKQKGNVCHDKLSCKLDSGVNVNDLASHNGREDRDYSVMEHQLPEIIVRNKENTCNVVKDICVDKGVPLHDRLFFRDHVDCKGVGNVQGTEGNFKVDEPALDGSDLLVGSEHIDLPTRTEKEDTDMSVEDNLATSTETSCLTIQNDSEHLSLASDAAMEDSVHARDGRKWVEGTTESDSEKVETSSSSIVFDIDPQTVASNVSKADVQNHGLEHLKSKNTSRLESSNEQLVVSSQLGNSMGEMSFSAAGPVSGRLTYSGPIPYSGSLSIRSDSSTASTRSFAFPAIQSEWNTSPVRMAKGERRNLGKHKGWRQGILCCRF